jgi:signal transduction histidine kinase
MSMNHIGSVLLERRKISRDLHDSTLQPYLGLKWALEAIQTKSAAGRPILEDLTRLVARVDHEILSMRRYVSSLRELTEGQATETAPVELSLVLLQQINRWRELYCLEVLVRTSGPARMVSDFLASAVLNIVNEGLSNIRRHTLASNAKILLFCRVDRIRLVIVNPVVPGATPTSFTPRSIDERVRALGGCCEANSPRGRETRVTVELPRGGS